MKTTIRTIALASIVAIASLHRQRSPKPASPPPGSTCLSHLITGRSTSRPAFTRSRWGEPDILTLSNGNRTAWAMIQAGYDPTAKQIGLRGLPQVRRPLFPHGIAPSHGTFMPRYSSRQRNGARPRFAANHRYPSRVQLAAALQRQRPTAIKVKPKFCAGAFPNAPAQRS